MGSLLYMICGVVTANWYYLHEKNPEWDVVRLKQMLQLLSLIGAMAHVSEVEKAIAVRDIRESVETVVTRNGTPAYDLVGYFNLLSNADQLTDRETDVLRELYIKYDDPFIRWMLSMRTQQYMNTHRSETRVEQRMFSVLGVNYIPRSARNRLF